MGVIVTLELGLLTNCPPAGGSAALFLSSNLSLLLQKKHFPSLKEKLSPDLLPCSRSSFPGGDDWASGGPAY